MILNITCDLLLVRHQKVPRHVAKYIFSRFPFFFAFFLDSVGLPCWSKSWVALVEVVGCSGQNYCCRRCRSHCCGQFSHCCRRFTLCRSRCCRWFTLCRSRYCHRFTLLCRSCRCRRFTLPCRSCRCRFIRLLDIL